MRYDLIEKVVIHKLGKGFDRRGRLATFYLKKVPNSDYGYSESARLIRGMINLLSSNYEMPWTDPEVAEKYLFGEAQDCWLNKDGEMVEGQAIPTLDIQHKYWGDTQIDAFRSICQTMALLHGWQCEFRI